MRRRPTLRVSCLGAVLLVLLSRPALAQDWDRWDSRWEAAWDRGYYQPSPPCSLDLRGVHATREGHAEWGLFATLQLPLAGCRAQQIDASRPSIAGDSETESGEPSEDSAGLLLTQARADAGEADVDVDPAPRPAPGREEPTVVRPAPLDPGWVREVTARALAASGLDAMDRSLTDQAARARSSGLLPELRLRGAVGLDNTSSLAGSGIYPGEATWRGGTDGAAEVRLTFRLNRLIFDDTEPGLERLRLQLLQARQKLTEGVVEMLYAWQRARLRSLSTELNDEERALAGLQVEELAMRLHVLTGGWFGSSGAGSSGAVRAADTAAPNDEAQAVPPDVPRAPRPPIRASVPSVRVTF